MRPFDWERDCLEDVSRAFPAIVGTSSGAVGGRGETLEESKERKMRTLSGSVPHDEVASA